MSKPFIKWVGGKRQLLPKIKELVPTQFNKYFEPFIGGGALFFDLNLNEAFINDFNPELTNLYHVVKTMPELLLESLKKHINTEEYFYALRNLDREEFFKTLSEVERASRFIFLNKTCFNGLYRVNKKGQNNVPYGKYLNPTIIDEENLFKCSESLKNTTILTGNFAGILPFVSENDFVYLDPPYAPVSTTANFTSYTNEAFGIAQQERLKEFCDILTVLGVKFLLSNSDVPLIRQLYSEYDIITVELNRTLSAKGSARGKVNEVLIKNYI